MSKPNLGLSRKSKTSDREVMTLMLERKKLLLAQARINLQRAENAIEPLTMSDTIMFFIEEYLKNNSTK